MWPIWPGRLISNADSSVGEPAKQTADYAKFEPEDPPLVLSLLPGHPAPRGILNHAGIRLADAKLLLALQARLETAGIPTQREEGVQCCHSTQTKFWVTDPDGALWELYIVEEGGGESEAGHDFSNVPAQTPAIARPPVIWRHQLPDPFPARIPQPDNSVQQVILEGTANLRPESTGLDTICSEAFRALRPGGELRLHGLAGDRPFPSSAPRLPGPAALVQHVPVETEPMCALLRAGFVQVAFEKLSPAPHFVVDGVQMREILLSGRKPGHRPPTANHQAVYLGPLAQVSDDFGNVFQRGQRVALNVHDWQVLAQSPVAGQFLFLPSGE